MKNNFDYIYYGSNSNAVELKRFITHLFNVNENAEKKGLCRTAISIWGKHGIGKTQIVEEIARENNYELIYIAPAQFEEMGDLIGMPKIIGEDQSASTSFIPPSWVPKNEGPGILLLDDINRADDRILRGIMQLLQHHELVSWKLPPKWHIVCTANPDGGDYSVTPMDFAMLTRMMHITFTFDVAAWAVWAEKNSIDSRGIQFVLSYPELLTGERTTPRTLVQFFEAISIIENLEKELPLVKQLASSCLDEEVAYLFLTFVKDELCSIVEPCTIINASDFNKDVYELLSKEIAKDETRIDILNITTTRLINYIRQKKVTDKHLENIRAFLKMDILPNDLRLLTAQEIVGMPSPQYKKLFADPMLGKILLDKF
jgi:hypothetical protein